jgi:hypothetical protein
MAGRHITRPQIHQFWNHQSQLGRPKHKAPRAEGRRPNDSGDGDIYLVLPEPSDEAEVALSFASCVTKGALRLIEPASGVFVW